MSSETNMLIYLCIQLIGLFISDLYAEFTVIGLQLFFHCHSLVKWPCSNSLKIECWKENCLVLRKLYRLVYITVYSSTDFLWKKDIITLNSLLNSTVYIWTPRIENLGKNEYPTTSIRDGQIISQSTWESTTDKGYWIFQLSLFYFYVSQMINVIMVNQISNLWIMFC